MRQLPAWSCVSRWVWSLCCSVGVLCEEDVNGGGVLGLLIGWHQGLLRSPPHTTHHATVTAVPPLPEGVAIGLGPDDRQHHKQ